MIRRPLRPIAPVLQAREQGINPDLIEAQGKVARMQGQRKAERRRAESRLVLLAFMMVLAFGSVGWKMSVLATSETIEPINSWRPVQIVSQRADIVDRNGEILATNLVTTSLIARPQMMVDPRGVADGLAEIFDDLDADRLYARFSGSRTFVWVKHKMSPEQVQSVHDLGQPGLQFGPRELRLYPNGNLASHILGGSAFGIEGELSAEVIGTAGVELKFDEYLRDTALDGAALELSIDIAVQAAMRRVLVGGMSMMEARGAAAVLMEVDTGRVIAMVSLPDFDPNHRPNPPVSGDPADSPLFNRAAQGMYELGSTFKLFTAALAMDIGFANPNTMIDTKGPIYVGGFEIDDFHKYGNRLSLMDVIVRSSNVGTANLATDMGTEAQQAFLKTLGMLDITSVEIPEAGRSKPIVPRDWTELSTMTISYGHGLAATPLHLAAAYATITNGGLRVSPTLLNNSPLPTEDDRVVSRSTSDNVANMLRQVVVRGTASQAEVPGYQVGGKTGSADKPNPQGGYYEDKVISTFAAVFPTSAPKYVLVVTLDEPEVMMAGELRRTAGWTAVPVTREIIRRIAPLMGMRPEWYDDDAQNPAIALTRN